MADELFVDRRSPHFAGTAIIMITRAFGDHELPMAQYLSRMRRHDHRHGHLSTSADNLTVEDSITSMIVKYGQA